MSGRRGGKRQGGKRRGGPWYGEFRERIRFESPGYGLFRDLKGSVVRQVKEPGYRLIFSLDVPHYGRRRIELRFPRRAPTWVRVYVDGSDEAPHRYAGGSLCMWDPEDPPTKRWIFQDGLLALVGHITAHLFREGWWREYGEWLGPEASHDPKTKGDPAQ